MSHPEICHLLTVILHALWWVVFPALLICIVFFLVCLTHNPPGE